VIYIESLASWLPPIFWKSNERFGEERNIKRKIFKALQCAPTRGEGLEKTLQGLRRHFSPPSPIVIIISDAEEKEKVEKKISKAETEAKQLVEVEQLVDFLA
jgi:hypothetical protein